MTTKTSIKIKKFWVSPIAADGGMGTQMKEIQLGQREATVQFNGSDADVTNYKNIVGSTLESSTMKGDKTMNFQFADLTPEAIAIFTGGTVTSTAAADSFDAPENENQSVELSIMFLTDRNVLFRMPRVSVDAFPTVNDDDLHFFQVNGVVLLPSKAGVTSFGYDVIKQTGAHDILTFTLPEQSAAATISAVNHTVGITVVSGTSKAALTPSITTSLGASVTPNAGVETDFTSPVTYVVTAADGTTQNWTVTVTVAA